MTAIKEKQYGLKTEVAGNADTETSFVRFNTGNTLVIDKDGGEIRLLDSNDMLQLVVVITEKGLVVDVKASQLNIQAAEQINLSAKRINIDASEQLNLTSAGNMVQQVEKDFLTETAGTNKSIAKIQKITASLGNVELKANDDIRLEGERVLLNCD